MVLAITLVLAAFACTKSAEAQEQAREGRRVALVVGISKYDSIYELENASADASSVAETLKTIGFDVTLLQDASRAKMLDTIDAFKADANGADAALFYFAGHGFQYGGVNYLVPRDAVLNDKSGIGRQTVSLNDVIAKLEDRRRQTLIFLDACRNNPLPAKLRAGMAEGLSQVETGTGTFVAFATQPGNVTRDGAGEHSPFTRAFVDNLTEAGLSISDLMIQVRNDVQKDTLFQQTPWDQSSLRSQFYFVPQDEADADLTDEDREMLRSLPANLRAKFESRFGITITSADAEPVTAEVSSDDAPNPQDATAAGVDDSLMASSEIEAAVAEASGGVEAATSGPLADDVAGEDAGAGDDGTEDAMMADASTGDAAIGDGGPGPVEPSIRVAAITPSISILQAVEDEAAPKAGDVSVPDVGDGASDPSAVVSDVGPTAAAAAPSPEAPPVAFPVPVPVALPVPIRQAAAAQPSSPHVPTPGDTSGETEIASLQTASPITPAISILGVEDLVPNRAGNEVAAQKNETATDAAREDASYDIAMRTPLDRLDGVNVGASGSTPATATRAVELSTTPTAFSDRTLAPVAIAGPSVVGREAQSRPGAERIDSLSPVIAPAERIIGEEVASKPKETQLASLGPDVSLAPDTEIPSVVPVVPREGDDGPDTVTARTLGIDEDQLPRAVQGELKRLGCYRSAVDNVWGANSERALLRYYANKQAEPDDTLPTPTVLSSLRLEDEVICKLTRVTPNIQPPKIQSPRIQQAPVARIAPSKPKVKVTSRPEPRIKANPLGKPAARSAPQKRVATTSSARPAAPAVRRSAPASAPSSGSGGGFNRERLLRGNFR